MKIFVQTKTDAFKNDIELIDKNHFLVKTKEPPINNRANDSVVKLISEYLKIPKSSISIARGLKSKQKILEIKI